MSDENIKIDRDYTDIFSIKDMTINKIMPMFFSEETSNLTAGELGVVSELVGTVTEDSYNTSSVLLMETFPNRARMSSSIHSNAAIFQLSNIFASAATCTFLILLSEDDVIANSVSKNSYDSFYIGKNTIIYVEDIPFSLDYDIEIRSTIRNDKRIFSAKYIMDTINTNSVSNQTDPYIKMRRSSNGVLALQVSMSQYTRSVSYESIIDNSKLNYPTISFSYSDKIAGFDVFYKAPGDNDYNTKLETKVEYSLPSKNPFCYYKSSEEGRITLSFTTKDGYFQPKFNSEVKIVVYNTLGNSGNFDMYKGDNVSISKDSDYDYNRSWVITAKPVTASKNGKDPLTDEGLQALTVEGFSTATVLSTEQDLQTYFNNYKYRYNNEVLFIKKRDDAVERLFSAFMFIKKDDYFFPTNTLNLSTNINTIDKISDNTYVIDPGYLFTYKGDSTKQCVFIEDTSHDNGYTKEYDEYIEQNNAEDSNYYYIINDYDNKLYDGFYICSETSADYYDIGGFRDSSKDISDVTEVYKNTKKYIQRNPDYIDWVKISNKYLDMYNIFSAQTEDEITYEKYKKWKYDLEEDQITEGIYEEYLVYLHINNIVTKPDLTFKAWMAENEYKHEKLTLYNLEKITGMTIDEFAKQYEFLYTNPFMANIIKQPNHIGYYLTDINQDSILDFIRQNDSDSFIQFITYTLNVSRDLSAEKKYKFAISIAPSVTAGTSTDELDNLSYADIIYDIEKDEQFRYDDTLIKYGDRTLSTFNKEKLVNNNLRVIIAVVEDGEEIAYTELIPTAYDKKTQILEFEGEFFTDDYVTTTDKFRNTHRCPYCGHIINNSVNDNDDEYRYVCDINSGGCGRRYKNGFINIKTVDDLLFDITDCDLRIYTLFKDPNNTKTITDNGFYVYDKSYEGYIWTNIYETISDPITFIKPLNMLTSNIYYEDWYLPGVIPCDCMIYSVPLLKYSVLAYKDSGMEITTDDVADDIGQFAYFMNAFMDNYNILEDERSKLKNASNIDVKFYNTYGKSTNFTIGDNSEIIDTINISISFKVWLTIGADKTTSETELKKFIKTTIESINNDGTNNLYISNLMRKIEDNFPYVDHIKFKGINKYSTDYQTVKNTAIKLTDLSKEERRYYVPDLLVVNKDKINLEIVENA